MLKKRQTPGKKRVDMAESRCKYSSKKMLHRSFTVILLVTLMSTIANAAIDQTITFDPICNKRSGDAAFSLTATASSSLPVSYTSSDQAVATISGSTVTVKGIGRTAITASQSGNATYNAATSVSRTLTVTDNYLTFKINDFSLYDSILKKNNDAVLSGTSLKLVDAANDQWGSAFNKKKIVLDSKRRFSTFFTFNIDITGNDGADGFCFVLQGATSSSGGTGEGLGYSGISGRSLAIEFDIYGNGTTRGDGSTNNNGDGNHIAIDTNCNLSNPVGFMELPLELTGANRYVWIESDGDSIYIRINSSNNKSGGYTLKAALPNSNNIPQESYVGFTAATGGAYGAHVIKNWYFDNEYEECSVDSSTTLAEAPTDLSLVSSGAGTQRTITATLKNTSGTAVSGMSIDFSVKSGDATLSSSSATTNASGIASVTLTRGNPGKNVVSAKISTGAYTESDTVIFLADEPTTQASAVSATQVGANSMALAWTRGNGDSTAVFMKAASGGSASPIDGTAYTSNAAFGSGSQISSSGWYCVYKGTGTTATVTNLSAETTYRIMAVEFKGNISAVKNYLTSDGTGNPVNQQTISNEPTTQASGITALSITKASMTVGWTRGNGAKTAVFMNASSSGSALPADQETYTADSVFGSGAQIGSGGWYCIYNGTGTSQRVIGLTKGTVYRIMAVEHNGSGSLINYFTATGAANPANATTLQSQTITFNALSDKIYGDASYGLSSSASSGLSITYSSSDNTVAKITGSVVSITGAGTATITASQAGNTTFESASAQQQLTVNKKALSVKEISMSDKVYDRTTDATITGTAALDGLVSGDESLVTLGGTPVATFSDANAGISRAVSVNGYAISGSASSNYSLTQPSGLTASITVKSLTITGITADDKMFDKTVTVTINGTPLLNGLVNGDESSVSIGGTPAAMFADVNTGTAKTVTVSGYSLDGSAASNYSLSLPSGLTASITPKTLSITADAKSKVYGAADVALTYSASGLENGDLITGTLSRIPGETNGTYSIEQGTLSAGSNYTIAYTGALFTITTKTVNVVADAKTKVYGDPDPEFTYTVSGLENGDVLTGSLARAAGDSADTYAITQGTLANSNYALSFTSANLTISRKTVSISGIGITDKVYDKTVTATINGTPVFAGLVTGDESYVSIGGTPVAAFADANAGAGRVVTVNGYILNGSKALNYSLEQPSGFTAAITQKVLTVSGIVAADKINDGSTNVVLSGGTLNGIEAGDTVSIDTIVGAFADTAAAADKNVAISSIKLEGAQAANYMVVIPDGVTADNLPAVPKDKPVVTNPQDAGSKGTVGNPPVFTWKYVDGAAKYHFQLSKAGGFDPLMIDTIVADTFFTSFLLSYSTVYFWRVSPVNLGGQGPWSDTLNIKTIESVPQGIPAITSVYPDTLTVGTTVTLSWDTVPDAARYRIQISSDTGFSTVFIDTATGDLSSIVVRGLGNDTTWYWRIAAVNNGGCGQWSETEKFTTVTKKETTETIVSTIITDSATVVSENVSVISDSSSAGTVITVEQVKNALKDSACLQTSPIYNFTCSEKTEKPDSLAIVFTIPDTLADGTIVTADLINRVRVYELDTQYNIRKALAGQLNFTARTITIKTITPGVYVLAIDTMPPNVVDQTNTTPKQSGSNPVISGTVTDNIPNCPTYVYYRKGGENKFDSVTVALNEDGTFALPVQTVNLDSNGFEYYIAAYDGRNKITLHRQDIPVSVTNAQDTAAFPKSQWYLFSTPLTLSETGVTGVLKNMGKYGTDWKMFRRSLTSVADSFVEYGENLDTLNTGYSYWLKTNRDNMRLSVDSGKTTQVSTCFSYTIPARAWAAIGDPYMFPVSWQSIVDSSKVTIKELIGPYTYKDSAWIPPTDITYIVPWQGYYLYNNSDSAVTMRIPSLRYQGVLSKLAKMKSDSSSVILDWEVSSKYGRDYRNYFGFVNGAVDEFDAGLDCPKPGAPSGNGPVTWFTRRTLSKAAARFQTDFTSSAKGGSQWPIAVGNLSPGTVYQCSVSKVKNIADSIVCVLVDYHAGTIFNLKDGAYSFTALENESTRALGIVMGSESFINSQLKGVRLVPKTFLLSKIYPNPMRRSTQIHYALPWSEHGLPVKMDVFDIRGRCVVELVNKTQDAGYYTVNFDLEGNNGGAQISGGIYILRLKAGNKIKNTPLRVVR